MNEIEFAHLKYSDDFHFLHFSVGRVLMIASLSETKFEVYLTTKVQSTKLKALRVTTCIPVYQRSPIRDIQS
jgi:hypothetical protein